MSPTFGINFIKNDTMKNSIKLRSLLLIFALAAGTFTSCKDKETTVDETTTTETTIETDTTSVPPVTEEVPADTTTTGTATATPTAD